MKRGSFEFLPLACGLILPGSSGISKGFGLHCRPMSPSLQTKVAEFADQSRRVCRPKSPSLPTKVAEFADQIHCICFSLIAALAISSCVVSFSFAFIGRSKAFGLSYLFLRNPWPFYPLSRKRSASIAAWQPVPAALMA